MNQILNTKYLDDAVKYLVNQTDESETSVKQMVENKFPSEINSKCS